MGLCGKVIHRNRDAAITAAAELMAHGRDVGRRRLNVYSCAKCSGYHVGHRPRVLLKDRQVAVPPVVEEVAKERCECACRKAATKTIKTPRGPMRVCAHHAELVFRSDRTA
jgi:hypothetical protein